MGEIHRRSIRWPVNHTVYPRSPCLPNWPQSCDLRCVLRRVAKIPSRTHRLKRFGTHLLHDWDVGDVCPGICSIPMQRTSAVRGRGTRFTDAALLAQWRMGGGGVTPRGTGQQHYFTMLPFFHISIGARGKTRLRSSIQTINTIVCIVNFAGHLRPLQCMCDLVSLSFK